MTVATTAAARPCPSCGSTGTILILAIDRIAEETGEPFEVVSCSGCELRFTRPLPTAAELSTLYDDEFYGAQPRRGMSWDVLRGAFHQVVLGHRRKALMGRRPGRVLDVGCGDGDFLLSLKRRGWDTTGIEYSESGCRLARSRGLVVHQGELLSADLANGSFDAITMWHVLEHLPDPAAALDRAVRLLAPGGLLVIEVPDSGSPTFRLTRDRWYPLDVPRHLQHFTPESLRTLVSRWPVQLARVQRFHLADSLLTFVSLLSRYGVFGRFQSSHYFVGDFRRASAGKRALFLVQMAALAPFSFLFSILSVLFSGHGETVTFTFTRASE